MKTFSNKVTGHATIALDTSVFIYHLEENRKYLSYTGLIFEKLLPEGKVKAACATLVLTELLVRPMKEKRLDLMLSYKALIIGFPQLTLIPLDSHVAEQAAYIRSAYSHKTPDSIHLASAIAAGATLIIGNDRKWKNVREIEAISLDDYLNT